MYVQKQACIWRQQKIQVLLSYFPFCLVCKACMYFEAPCRAALLDWGDSSSTDCSGTKFLAQSKGGDPIKDETIQSSVESLAQLMPS